MKSGFLNSKTIQKIIFPLINGLKSGIPDSLPASVLKRNLTLMREADLIDKCSFNQNANVLIKPHQ